MTPHPVTSLEELKGVFTIPFEPDREAIKSSAHNFKEALAITGDRGILRASLSSPIVVISGLMDFELFLELSLLERDFFHTLLTEITHRILTILEILFEDGAIPPRLGQVNLGGSEQCTPPMMHPASS